MNNADNVMAFVVRRMAEFGYKPDEYNTSTEQNLIAASGTCKISDVSDIFFLSNIYSANAGVINATIISDDNAEPINPLFLNKNYDSIQIYRGTINITNLSAVGNLYVEFIRVSPKVRK